MGDPIYFEQESFDRILYKYFTNEKMWKNLFFSNIFQLLPVWVMLLIQFVSEYSFPSKEYIGNLLVFVVIACATNLSNLFGKNNFKTKEISITFEIFVLVFVLCFASILYCLLLLYDQTHLKIKMNILLYCSLFFTLIAVLINVWQTVRKDI